jgi:tetratricopeptide (TPR) repeat protein/predicted Ser/Thr protein kinase
MKSLWKDLDGIRLGELAVAHGWASLTVVERTLEAQAHDKRPIGHLLCDQGVLTTERLALLLVEQADLTGRPCAATRAGKYLLLHALGRGGMGVVWRAWDAQLGRAVALKILHAVESSEERARFLREAQIAARLSHPGIVPVHEILEVDGQPAIAMGLVDGRSLRPGDRSVPFRRAVEAVRDAARAVQAAHDQGVVHRDLKPENIMIARDGRAFVMDFGVAKSQRANSALTVTGLAIGTPAYMSPEQARGQTTETGPRSDVYGLGATLWAMAAGHAPFDGRDAIDVIRRAATEEPPRLPSRTPRDLETVIVRAMQKEPARRYATAGELADDLDRFLRGDPVRARPVTVIERAWRAVRRHSVAAAALGSLALLLVGAAVVTLATRTRFDRRAAASLLFEEGKRYYDDARLLAHRPDATTEAVEKLIERAKPPLLKAAETDPTWAEPEHYLGRCHMLVGSGAASRHLTEAIRRNAAYLEPYLDRGIEDLLDEAAHGTIARTRTPERIARAQSDFERYAAGRGEPQLTSLARGALALLRDDLAEAKSLLAPLEDEPRLGDYACLLLGLALRDDPRLAEAALLRAIGRRPLFFSAHWQLAHAQMRTGRMTEAIATLEKAERTFPRLRAALVARRAIALLYLDRRDEARRLLDEALALPETDDLRRTWRAEALGTRARLQWQQRRDRDAEADARAALAIDAANVEALRVLVEIEVERRAFDEALSRCDELERIDPRAGHAWVCRVLVHQARGDRDRALEAAERGIDKAPGEAELRVHRARIREERGLLAEAEEDFRKAAQLHPGWLEPTLGLARMWSRARRPERALEVLDEALKAAPRSPRLHVERSTVLVRLKRGDDALQAARAAEEVEPGAHDVQRALALALEFCGDLERALEVADVAVRLKPDVDNFVMRARLHESLNHRTEFFADVESAVKLGSRNAGIWSAYAYFLLDAGRLDEAEKAHRTLLDLVPGEPRHWYNLGHLLLARGRSVEAVEAFTKARDGAPKDARTRVGLADALEHAGRRREAAAEWEEAVKLDPSLESRLRPLIENARRN